MKILIKYIFSFKKIPVNMIYFTKKKSKELNKRKTKKKNTGGLTCQSINPTINLLAAVAIKVNRQRKAALNSDMKSPQTIVTGDLQLK